MIIYNCKCNNCKAEFQAALENENEVFECPACNQTDINREKTEIEFGCGGGGCSSCSGCH